MKKIKKAWFMLLVITLIGSVGCGKKVESKEDTSQKISTEETHSTEQEGVVDNEAAVPTEDNEAITETLPIGTIVKVVGMDEKYMITVHDYVMKEMPDTTWQYAACIYPQGNMSETPAMVFNNEDIAEVVYKGLESMDVAFSAVYEVKEGYLPIGTVVGVQGADVPLMIFGRSQQQGGTENVYDYVAAEYPAGNVDPNASYLFNKDIIETIYFLGYSDEQETEFVQMLESSK